MSVPVPGQTHVAMGELEQRGFMVLAIAISQMSAASGRSMRASSTTDVSEPGAQSTAFAAENYEFSNMQA